FTNGGTRSRPTRARSTPPSHLSSDHGRSLTSAASPAAGLRPLGELETTPSCTSNCPAAAVSASFLFLPSPTPLLPVPPTTACTTNFLSWSGPSSRSTVYCGGWAFRFWAQSCRIVL